MTKDPLQILLEKKLGIHVPEHEPDEPNPAPVALNNDAALATIALGTGNPSFNVAETLRAGLNPTNQERN
jgi:hypothetical protein